MEIKLTMFSYIGAIFIQDSVFAGFIVPPTDLILTSSYARRTYVGSKRFNSGKLSTWFVRETHNKGKRLSNTYLLTSTVIPLRHTYLGSYYVRIRISEESTDVSLYLMYEGMLWYYH
jgi:hypothetical protein